MTTDPARLEVGRLHLLGELRELRRRVAGLTAGYRELGESGALSGTDGIGAPTTPDYCLAGAADVFAEALLELDAATDALDRVGDCTGRLCSVPWPIPS
ncbi:hypothetical protein [Nocardia brevicatena]|uniref:hypothetical protein n=1 Tax=Nocardia brevicatena TaxID=37327 RepID=UPI00031E30AD|nr:hypothetical protein [Nocardia brevicatena]